MSGDPFAEIEAAVKRLPLMDLAEFLRARRETEWSPPEPSVIPQPEFPVRFGGIVRYRCPLGCAWHHDENPGRDAAVESLRLTLPANCTPDDLSAALDAHANERARTVRARIEQAITDHYETAHAIV